MRLPLTVEEITASWLTEALQLRHAGVQVRALQVSELLHGTSTKARVRLDYADDCDLPATMIVKGGFEAHSAPMQGMYEREARFYNDVQPFLPINSPRCFYAGSDPDSYQSIVVMEDLDARAAHYCSALQTEGFADVARRLEAMAGFHAAFRGKSAGGVFLSAISPGGPQSQAAGSACGPQKLKASMRSPGPVTRSFGRRVASRLSAILTSRRVTDAPGQWCGP